MTPEELQEQAKRLRDGDEQPGRVVVAANGYATSPRRAALDYGIVGRLCFIRNDGWTLAAPVHLAGVAFATWSGSWAALVELPPSHLRYHIPQGGRKPN